MSSDDSKQPRPGANFPGAPPVREPFNRSIDLEAQIATLSPAGQQQCRAIQQLQSERTEAEQANQQRTHGFKVLRAKCELMENYIRHPPPRPAGVVADPTNDLKIIDQQAEAKAREAETRFLKNIERDAEANVRQVIARERKGHEPGRSDPGHDHGHGG